MTSKNRKDVQDALDESSDSYILITCSQPSKTGHMDVNLTYRGEPNMLSYLINGAQNMIEQDDQDDSV